MISCEEKEQYIQIRKEKEERFKKLLECAEENKISKDDIAKMQYELENKDKILETVSLVSNNPYFLDILDVNENEIYFYEPGLKDLKFVFKRAQTEDFVTYIQSLIEDNVSVDLFGMSGFYTIGDFEYWSQELVDIHFKWGYKE